MFSFVSNRIDLLIIVFYLLLTLVVGIYKGRGVKTVRDFAISDKRYTTPILVATIFGTLVDGGSTVGITEMVFTVGIVFIIISFGEPIVKILMSEFIAPRMGRFRNMLSAGDVMGSFYGKPGKLITGFCGLIVCIGYLGAQIKAFGVFFHHFTGISPIAAIIVGASIVIVYSAFGGIRAVTATDVVQFGVIVIAIPMIANVALMEVGGFQSLVSALPKEKLMVFPPSMDKLQVVLIFILYCIPFLNPAVTQRLLMARDTKQMITSLRISAILDVPFYATMGCIALCAYILSPAIAANDALPYLINTYLPIGVKGIAIAGMLSVIMSTADSYLNAASVAMVHDVIKPLSSKQLSNSTELKLTRLFTIIIGLLSIIAAISFKSVIELVLSFLNVWGPVVVVPMFAGIFGYKGTTKAFIFAVLSAAISFTLWSLLMPDVDGLIPSMAVNAITFFVVSYLDSEKRIARKKKRYKQFSFGLNSIRINSFLESGTVRNTVDSINQYTTFSIFYLATLILPYFMWTDCRSDNNTPLIILKLLTGLCCFLIILRDYWPKRLKRYLIIFWKFTLLFCLVFTPCYLSFENGFDVSSVINFSVYLLVLSLLVGWLDFLIVLFTGVLFAGILATRAPINGDNLFLLFYVGGFCSIAGMVFSRSREKAIQEKFVYFRSIAASIAHELRTPLSVMRMNNQLLEMHLGKLIRAFKLQSDERIPEQHLKKLVELPESQESTMRRAFLIIDLLLNNIKTFSEEIRLRELDSVETVNRALDEFPFRESERKIVKVDEQNRFTFHGDENIVKHILHNLLKNALHFTNDVENPQIEIRFQDSTDYNMLSFKDNGEGVKTSDLPYIFDDFYSKRQHGTGVGLSFCKMAMKKHKGDIMCISEFGKYTQFLLIFPKSKK